MRRILAAALVAMAPGAVLGQAADCTQEAAALYQIAPVVGERFDLPTPRAYLADDARRYVITAGLFAESHGRLAAGEVAPQHRQALVVSGLLLDCLATDIAELQPPASELVQQFEERYPRAQRAEWMAAAAAGL